MKVFSKVYEEQSFSRVSKTMQMNISSVSRIVARLEEELSTSLFTRNTRKIIPTESGDHFYAKVQKILKEVDQIKVDLETYNQQKIRYHISSDIAHFFSSEIVIIITRGKLEYDMEISHSTDMPDVIAQGLEFSLSLTSLKDSGLIGRKLDDGDLAIFNYGVESDVLFINKKIALKKSELLVILKDKELVFKKIIVVDNFFDALRMAQKLSASAIGPLFFRKLFSDKAVDVIEIDTNHLLGTHFGLYLVYTYNRYKNDKGKKIIQDIVNLVKGRIET